MGARVRGRDCTFQPVSSARTPCDLTKMKKKKKESPNKERIPFYKMTVAEEAPWRRNNKKEGTAELGTALAQGSQSGKTNLKSSIPDPNILSLILLLLLH